MGCDKNRVDTEKMLAKIKEKHNVTGEIEKADIIIVNTCAFLNSSRKESVEEILAAAEYKKSGSAKKLIVTGCLPQKFLKDTEKGFPEADAFLGVSDYEKINDVIDRITAGERVIEVGAPREEPGKKRLLTTDGYAFLKVADGCDNHCNFEV